jgi:hypothetical protein
VEEELLGTLPDRRLARKFNRSVQTVTQHRQAKGIPVFNPQRHRWTLADDKLLSERPDAQVALFLGISRMAVKHRRVRLGLPPRGRKPPTAQAPWQPQEDALLGTAPDLAVARKLGRPIYNVRRRRIQLGLQSPFRHWDARADALLGQMPDQAAARRLGRTVASVATRRKRLGIAAIR